MKRLKVFIHLLIIGGLLAPTLPTLADNFDPHSKRVNFTIGTGSAFGENYTIVGVGGGYYPIQGLELGLDGKLWFGGDADIYEITPSATYVVTQMQNFMPYVGVLYRKTYIEDYDDLDAYGGRAGIILQSARNVYMRAGVVAVEYKDCNDTVFRDCSDVYPEFTVGLSF